jgi:hypothetical protein
MVSVNLRSGVICSNLNVQKTGGSIVDGAAKKITPVGTTIVREIIRCKFFKKPV